MYQVYLVLFLYSLHRYNSSLLLGRVITIVIWQSFQLETSERMLQKSPWMLTRPQMILPLRTCLLLTQSDWVWPWTLVSFTMKSWTLLTEPVNSLSKHLMTPLLNWIPWAKNLTRTAPWSCSFWEITWLFGPLTFKKLVVRKKHEIFIEYVGGV